MVNPKKNHLEEARQRSHIEKIKGLEEWLSHIGKAQGSNELEAL